MYFFIFVLILQFFNIVFVDSILDDGSFVFIYGLSDPGDFLLLLDVLSHALGYF